MATRLVRYELESGGSVVVEEATDDRGAMVGHGDVVEAAGQSFEKALSALRPAAAAVLNEIEALVTRPDEVTLELGFSLKGEVGAIIAKTAAEGSFKLSLKWKPGSGPAQPS
jgi:hypothetical protein